MSDIGENDTVAGDTPKDKPVEDDEIGTGLKPKIGLHSCIYLPIQISFEVCIQAGERRYGLTP